MTFSVMLLKPLVRTVKVDFCLLLRETMPSQRADVWANADMEDKKTSIAASNNAKRFFTMESAPLVTLDLKTGSIVHPFSPLARQLGFPGRNCCTRSIGLPDPDFASHPNPPVQNSCDFSAEVDV